MWFSFFIGIVLLYLGSEALVRGSSSLAIRFNIKPLIIGLTVIAFGTSSPELVVSIQAVLTQHAEISLGDVIGSNIFNVAGILSFCAILRPIPLNKDLLKFNIPVMFFGFFLFSIFLLTGTISRLAGGIFVSCLVLYTLALYCIPKQRDLQEKEAAEEVEKPLKNLGLELVLILGGLAFLIYGAHLIVSSAVTLAKLWGVNEAVIALGIVALGTSLPEISCCLIALFRKKYDLLVGSIIGSNIFNIFSVIGIASLVRPIPVSNIRLVDLGMMFLSSVFILPFFQKDLIIHRKKAVFLICLYVFYILYLYRANGIL